MPTQTPEPAVTDEKPDFNAEIQADFRASVSKMFKENNDPEPEKPEKEDVDTPSDKPVEKPLENPVLPDDIDKLFVVEKDTPKEGEEEDDKKEEKPEDKPEDEPKHDEKPFDGGPKRLREELKRAHKELAEVRAMAEKASKLEEQVKVAEASSSTVVELEKQLTEYKKQIAATDFTKSDEFKKQFAQPYASALDRFGAIAKSFKDVDGKAIDPNTLLRWVRDFDQDAAGVESAIEDKLGTKPASLMIALNRASEAAEKYREGYEKSAELAEQYKGTQAKAKEAEAMNTVQKITAQRELYSKLAEAHANQAAVGFEFDEAERKVQTEIGKALDAAMESAEDEPSQLKAIAKLRNYAAAAPVLAKRIKAKDARIAKLERMLKDVEDTSPDVDAEGSSEDGKEGRSFMRLINR